MANLYYREDLVDDDFEVDQTIEVTGEEARHAVRVSRLRTGESTLVGNARGLIAHGVVTEAERESFSITVEQVQRDPAPALTIALVQALAKGDRDERAVEQATEFGVDVIVPWQAARSVSRWDGAAGADKVAKGVAKWARIAREAAKQSIRARVPVVRQPVSLNQLCALAQQPSCAVVVLHPRASIRLSEWASTLEVSQPHEVYVVVGPEGGISDDEIAALQAAGAHVQTLGEHVLRTSSAGPAALSVLNVALGRW